MNDHGKARRSIMYCDTFRCLPLTALITLLACTWSLAAAQTETLSRGEQEELVKEIAGHIEKIYPFPEIGRKMALGITDSLRAGRYSRFTDPAEFAQRLSIDLEALSHDAHMGLTHDPPQAARMKAWKEEGREDPFAAAALEAERWNNFGFKELKILEGNVGYLDLTLFFARKYAGETAVAAMGYFANCNALIIDLRNNGGGWDDMVTFLASYFFNTDAGIVIGIGMSTKDSSFYPSMTSTYVPGRLLADIPLYVLISRGTASGAEAFASIMKTMRKNTTLVGERTAGAENPLETVIIRNKYILSVPGWKKIFSRATSGWEGVGVEPDIEGPADSALVVAHRRALLLLKERATDEKQKERYQWALDGMKANSEPMDIGKALREAYGGHYGNRSVSIDGNVLYYQYKERPKRRMLAVSKEYFVVEGYDWFRVRFLKEKGEVVGFEEVRTDGSVVRCRRDQAE